MGKMKKTVFVLAVLFLASCTPTNAYCPPKDAERILDQFGKIDRKWTEAYNLAGSAAKDDMASAIDELQALQLEAGSIDVPECLELTQNALNNYMQRVINGFTAIKADESEDDVEKKFDSSDKFLDEFYDHIFAIQNCLPDCKKPE